MPRITDPSMLSQLGAPPPAPSGMLPGFGPPPDFDLKRPKAQADLVNTQTDQTHTALENNRLRAQAPTDAGMAQANLMRAQADAATAQQKADEARANNALATMAANSDLHGDAYLRKYVPQAQWNLVRAYARGDLGSRAGGLSTSMLPIIQHAMNYDPTTSGTTFPARVKMQSDLAGSQPGTAGGSLRAMEQMLLHGANVLTSGASLGNYGPGVAGTLGNMARTELSRWQSDPTLNAYEQEVKNYAPESQKGVAGSAGGVGEREERAAGYSASMPQASRVAALQADARMAFERMGAVNDQYKRIMGRDITDQLSPNAKHAYDVIMAGGYDKDGKALFPAKGYTPGSILGASGAPAGPSSPGGGTPPPWAGGPASTIASGATRSEADPKTQRLIDSMVRGGASADDINGVISGMGYSPIDQRSIDTARAYLKTNPNYAGPLSSATRKTSNSLLTQGAGSAVGTGALAGADAVLGGTLDEIKGAADSAFTGKPLSQSIAEANALKQAAYAAHPVASTLGGFVGTGAAMVGGGMALRGGAMATSLGRYAPYAGSGALGLVQGAGQDNDNRLGGAALGLAGGVIGQGLGELAAVPIGAGVRAIARTRPGRAVTGMMFRGIEPAASLSPAQASTLSVINGAGPDAIRSTLSDAQRLGLPMSLADTAPSLGELAGAAVRRSPNAANIAEGMLLPRNRGQFDRLGSAVSRDLWPVANIPQTSEDLMRQARTAAAPLYADAYAQPAVGSPELDSLLQTPAARSALSRAHTIAANERRDPRTLGFALDGDGNVTLNPVRSDLYGAHAQAQDTFTQAQAAHRLALRTPGMDTGATRDALMSARSGLKDATDALAAAPGSGTAATSPQYSPQTLDYVKRGLDDVIDGLPKGMNGRPVMDENYRAVDGVRRQMLTELDRLNPAYATARAAYAGPVSAREALNLGTGAVTMHPDELNILAGAQTPERLGQMQVGFRGELMNRAGNLRDSTNPWEAALGSPNARARVDTLYPGNAGNADLFRSRDLERQMAATSNRIIGNSKTAQRGIADQAFEGSPIPAMAMDAALAAHGAVPVASIARKLGQSKLSDMVTMGIGGRAVRKADELAPLLLNPDPAASSATIDDLVKQELARRAYVAASRPRRGSGMFGAGIGLAAAQR